MPQYLIKKISLRGFIILIIGSIISTVTLLILLSRLDHLRTEQQITEDAYNAMYAFKYSTEQLLTTYNLNEHRVQWLEKNQIFISTLDHLSKFRGERSEEFTRLLNVTQNEIINIVKQLDNPLFQAKNTMNKPLLRRLGEGLNTSKNSSYYIALSQLNNSIDYLKQYETFLLDELSELKSYHITMIQNDLEKIKLISIWLPGIILLLTIVFALYVSRIVGRMEEDLFVTYQDLQTKKQSLHHLAYHDSLTGLPNRAMLLDRLEQSIKHAKRSHKKSVVLFIDLDHFKNINDSFGHSLGDELLTIVSKQLQTVIRETDTVARLGGDEFIILLENVETIDAVSTLARKLIGTLKKPIELHNNIFHITLSIGISVYPTDGNKPEILIRNADSAMYKAKDMGRNNYQFYTSDMTERSLERIKMENALRDALTHNEFEVYYQPQIFAPSGKVIGLEALIRWNHPTEGMILPGKFIPLAEETGLIISIGEWVLKNVCRQQISWIEKGVTPVVVAVNLSAAQLQQYNFYEKVETILQESACPTELIELEMTESFFMKDIEHSITLLQRLNALDIRMSIDDFGTGYSSMSYLKRLPIQKLKIDQTFIRDINKDPEDAAIARTIIALGKGLGIDIIAEGVEELSQLEFLLQENCHYIQGYLYSKPLPLKRTEEILVQGVIILPPIIQTET